MAALKERTPPVVGELARRAAQLDVGGVKRRRLLMLLAAYADAGEQSPSLREIVVRAPLLRGWRTVDALLARLDGDGVITVHRAPRQRNRYELHLEQPSRPGAAARSRRAR